MLALATAVGGVAFAAAWVTDVPPGGAAPRRRLQLWNATNATVVSGVALYGQANCPCLVEDAPNGYLAAAPDDVANTCVPTAAAVACAAA